jgi:hypothetical protein
MHADYLWLLTEYSLIAGIVFSANPLWSIEPMSTPQKALAHFLNQYCEVKSIPAGAGSAKERCYVMDTEDCLLFMAEMHVQEMRNALDQTDAVMAEAKRNGDFSTIIMTYNWGAPEPGMDSIRIPVKLVESFDNKRALMILRSLQGIQRDIEDGKACKEGLQALFQDTAVVMTSSDLEGERIYLINGKKSAADRRYDAARYAEKATTNLLFNLPKALNARLQTIVPKEARGRFFLEGRDITARKIHASDHSQAELALSDEGAAVYTELTKKNPRLAESIGKLFRQAMLDPLGLSLKYYMGKHALIQFPSGKDAREE